MLLVVLLKEDNKSNYGTIVVDCVGHNPDDVVEDVYKTVEEVQKIDEYNKDMVVEALEKKGYIIRNHIDDEIYF